MRVYIIMILVIFSSFSLIAQENNRATNLFSKSPQQIYLGAVMSKKSINTEKHIIKDIKTNQKLPCLSSVIKYKPMTFVPSLENMNRVIRDEMEKRGAPTGTGGLASGGTLSLNSLSELNIRFGQTVDIEKWFGIDPKSPLPKSNMLIEYEVPLFDIYVDYGSEELMLYQEELTKLKDDDLIFVSSITWGRKAIILIQSDFEEDKLRPTINKYINNDPLTEDEKIIIATANYSYNIFEDVPLEINDPNPIKSVQKYIEAPISINNYGRVIYFTANNPDRSIFENAF